MRGVNLNFSLFILSFLLLGASSETKIKSRKGGGSVTLSPSTSGGATVQVLTADPDNNYVTVPNQVKTDEITNTGPVVIDGTSFNADGTLDLSAGLPSPIGGSVFKPGPWEQTHNTNDSTYRVQRFITSHVTTTYGESKTLVNLGSCSGSDKIRNVLVFIEAIGVNFGTQFSGSAHYEKARFIVCNGGGAYSGLGSTSMVRDAYTGAAYIPTIEITNTEIKLAFYHSEVMAYIITGYLIISGNTELDGLVIDNT